MGAFLRRHCCATLNKAQTSRCAAFRLSRLAAGLRARWRHPSRPLAGLPARHSSALPWISVLPHAPMPFTLRQKQSMPNLWMISSQLIVRPAARTPVAMLSNLVRRDADSFVSPACSAHSSCCLEIPHAARHGPIADRYQCLPPSRTFVRRFPLSPRAPASIAVLHSS